jgi:hypothetical protein
VSLTLAELCRRVGSLMAKYPGDGSPDADVRRRVKERDGTVHRDVDRWPLGEDDVERLPWRPPTVWP